MDKPAPNQISGILASKFFKEKNRQAILEHIVKLWRKFNRSDFSENAKIIFRELLQRLSVIRREIASDGCVLVMEFFIYYQDTYIFILKSFPWCLISNSLHRLLAHVWEHILLDNNFGLAAENEQVIECGDKARWIFKVLLKL